MAASLAEYEINDLGTTTIELEDAVGNMTDYSGRVNGNGDAVVSVIQQGYPAGPEGHLWTILDIFVAEANEDVSTLFPSGYTLKGYLEVSGETRYILYKGRNEYRP